MAVVRLTVNDQTRLMPATRYVTDTVEAARFPTDGNEVADGDTSWSNPGNIYSDNAAAADVSLVTGAQSHTIRATEFGYTIAAGRITVVKVSLDVVDVNGTINWKHVYLVLNGVRIGSEMSGGALITGAGVVEFSQNVSLLPADVNADGFGVDIAVDLTGASGDVQLDYVSTTLTVRT